MSSLPQQVKKKPPKGLTFPQPNAGIAADYERRLKRLIREMGQAYLTEVLRVYRQARTAHIQDEAPNQPRDRWGRWVATGGHKRATLQRRYASLLDRLEKEDAHPAPYGDKAWTMPSTGYDTRQEEGITRPVVLGEVPHPEDHSVKVPVIFREGMQKTTKINGKGWGRRHIEYRHGKEIRDAGFKDALAFVAHIARHHTLIAQGKHPNNTNLIVQERHKPDLKEVLHLIPDGEHYRVTTAYPLKSTND